MLARNVVARPYGWFLIAMFVAGLLLNRRR